MKLLIFIFWIMVVSIVFQPFFDWSMQKTETGGQKITLYIASCFLIYKLADIFSSHDYKNKSNGNVR